jgi:hypothetical protein
MTALTQSSKSFHDGVKETLILLALAFLPAIEASGYGYHGEAKRPDRFAKELYH